MPLPRPIPRPSTLPLPRQVAELVPPPSVPTELATPSPTRPRPPSFNFKNNNKVQTSKTESTTAVRKVSSKSTTSEDTSDDGRGSSVSPTLQPKLRPMIGRTKSQPKTSGLHHGGQHQQQQKGEQKFVRSLNQHIQQSSMLYQQSGTQMILKAFLSQNDYDGFNVV